MATTTIPKIKNTATIGTLVSKDASSVTITAGNTADVNMGVNYIPDTGILVSYIGRYAGNPKCVITNIYRNNEILYVTVFNPTSASQKLGTVSVLKLHRNA